MRARSKILIPSGVKWGSDYDLELSSGPLGAKDGKTENKQIRTRTRVTGFRRAGSRWKPNDEAKYGE